MNSMILLAAGKGQRVGAAINKMLIKVQGKPIFWHSLQHILTSQLLNEIIVVVQEREDRNLNQLSGLLIRISYFTLR